MFKIGDEVKVLSCPDFGGRIGVVKFIDDSPDWNHHVSFDDGVSCHFNEKELEPAHLFTTDEIKLAVCQIYNCKFEEAPPFWDKLGSMSERKILALFGSVVLNQVLSNVP